MIQEIVKFVEHLERQSPEIFSEGLELKEGIYVFLEKEGDELVVKKENVLKVDKDTERNQLYEKFLALITNTEMLNAMKSFNSGPKIYIAIGTPFGIALNGKAYKKNSEKKLLDAADAYFKAARKYMNPENAQHAQWCSELERFVKTKMIDFLNSDEENEKVKDQFMFYFFMKEPALKDYQEIQTKFLSEKLFNKDKFNVKTENEELFGISDNLSGFNDKKDFLKHKTAPIELNYRVNGIEAQKLFNFFQLQQKNKVLPNPFPLFVDEQELSEEAIKFYKNSNKKYGHKEIVEELINKKQGDLQNYYLIYFNNREKGSRIIDLDFVPVFRYKIDDVKLEEPFPIGGKFKNLPITNIFEFQQNIFNKIFNGQLVTETKAGGLWIKYFDDMDVETKYGNATEKIVNLFYMYRKSIYDYVYKSKTQAITDKMFQDMMRKSIMDDIKHDKQEDKEYRIKEKLNIWFSMYNYFTNSKTNKNMVNKTQELFEKLKTIAGSENNAEFIKNDDEFAFAAGQLIRTILNKSESGERSHALLEPFLQKTECGKLKLAIARAFDTYKHAFKFYKGDANRYEFDKIMSNVMGYETKTNMKDLLPMILAGYFSETIFKKEKEKELEQSL
jgi:CRISPR-associated protein Csh1